MILDATCSTLKIWPKKASLRMDVRREVLPELQADARFMPFADHSIDALHCDPPHLIDRQQYWQTAVPKYSKFYTSVNRKRKGMYFQYILHSFGRFGLWETREQWLEFVQATNEEFHRVLKPNGTLFYKLGETREKRRSIKLDELLSGMSRFIETEDKRKTTKSPNGNPTYWLTMKPKEASQ